MNQTVSILEYQALKSDYCSLQTKYESAQRELEKLANQIRLANRKQFGSKADQISPHQLELGGVAAGAIALERKEEAPVSVKSHTRVISRGRKPLPEDLPRKYIEHQPAEQECSCCGSALVEIGREETEVIEYIPASVEIHVHQRVKKACAKCAKHGVAQGEIPEYAQPLPKCRPGAGLLSHIIVSKFRDALPYHRQSEMFARLGIEIARQRMSDWTIEVAILVTPVYEELLRVILESDYVQADETTLKVQDRNVINNIITGYLWGVLQPRQLLVWYKYAPTRAGHVPEEIFAGYEGAVQTDLYAGYNKIYLPEQVNRLACFAHIRRKFIESVSFAPYECNQIVQIIKEIYKQERKLPGDSAKEILAHRQAHSLPLLSKLHGKLIATQASLLPKNGAQDAITYALKQWREVERIFESGYYELDNNAIERQMKPIAIGRKNYLFAGSDDGAKAAAILYSLLNSCALHKVNPYQYLKDIITQCAVGSESLRNLLPDRWKHRQQQERSSDQQSQQQLVQS